MDWPIQGMAEERHVPTAANNRDWELETLVVESDPGGKVGFFPS
jgi:hypothetical protein